MRALLHQCVFYQRANKGGTRLRPEKKKSPHTHALFDQQNPPHFEVPPPHIVEREKKTFHGGKKTLTDRKSTMKTEIGLGGSPISGIIRRQIRGHSHPHWQTLSVSFSPDPNTSGTKTDTKTGQTPKVATSLPFPLHHDNSVITQQFNKYELKKKKVIYST